MQAAVLTTPRNLPAQAFVGKIRRFGVYGVLYEVLAIVAPDMARIRVIDTGEVTDYRLDRLLADPED